MRYVRQGVDTPGSDSMLYVMVGAHQEVQVGVMKSDVNRDTGDNSRTKT